MAKFAGIAHSCLVTVLGPKDLSVTKRVKTPDATAKSMEDTDAEYIPCLQVNTPLVIQDTQKMHKIDAHGAFCVSPS